MARIKDASVEAVKARTDLVTLRVRQIYVQAYHGRRLLRVEALHRG